MKFLADMGISPKTVAVLRALGHDATHLQEQRLERLPDSAILAKALEETRILLTHDGFWRTGCRQWWTLAQRDHLPFAKHASRPR